MLKIAFSLLVGKKRKRKNTRDIPNIKTEMGEGGGGGGENITVFYGIVYMRYSRNFSEKMDASNKHER